MRVLITGIGGFIGRHLARHLQDVGHEVHGLALSNGSGLEAFKMSYADIRDAAKVEAVVAACRPDAVVHLAGLSRPRDPANPPETFRRVNVEGTRHVIQALRDRPTTRVILASSGQVYGIVDPDQQPIAEDHSRNPKGHYAESKAAAEDIVLAYPSGIVVRSFNTIGRGQPEGFALPDFADRLAAIRAGTLERFECGNLESKLDFLHVSDAVEGYRCVLERGELGATYNLASGEAREMRSLLDQLMKISGVATEVHANPKKAFIQWMQGDNRRLRALGWRLEHGVDEALQDLWDEVAETTRPG